MLGMSFIRDQMLPPQARGWGLFPVDPEQVWLVLAIYPFPWAEKGVGGISFSGAVTLIRDTNYPTLTHPGSGRSLRLGANHNKFNADTGNEHLGGVVKLQLAGSC
jgi:hypothetical protein